MALHPQAAAYLALFPSDLGADLASLTREQIAEMRTMDGLAEQRGPRIDLPVVRDETVAGVPVRIYRPEPGERPLPVLVYFHGGGWVFGSVERNDPLARDLAARTGAVVVSVDYRLAPEDPFPAAADDAFAVVRDVHARPGFYGGDAGRVAVVGDSAGGNLAAVAAWLARDAGLHLSHQVLIYPVVDVACDTPSYRANAKGFGLEAAEMRWFVEQYAGGADPRDPRLAPLHLPDKSGLAPATVITAEYDPLCDEGAAYARALAEAGVPVEHRSFEGALHGFLGLPGFFDQAVEGREFLSARLKEAFA
ncbi:alpha/beta hydrolase [Microbispora triticiradicis]|uniref:Alpha/beta hydrolase n=2 Tax=Microbispora TaxID=2005 RepID=A0ABY3LQA3_9ACTN|nr:MULTISPECIES: alpha/beta hydrolase [Microbispora]TLP60773.1 alpha/beta hydrolase [Microbispora fusca]TYB47669.1 alpha/beta hydrolase [Microbispora tritici]GLW25804.1 acetylhydrolase [Microbispora amethystogenes]